MARKRKQAEPDFLKLGIILGAIALLTLFPLFFSKLFGGAGQVLLSPTLNASARINANASLHPRGLEFAADSKCTQYIEIYSTAGSGLTPGKPGYSEQVAQRRGQVLDDAQSAGCLVAYRPPKSAYLKAIWSSKRPKLTTGGECQQYVDGAEAAYAFDGPDAQTAEAVKEWFAAAAAAGCIQR